jgi:hypothetical protein
MHPCTNRFESWPSVNRLALNLIGDPWTLRLFLTLVIIDFVFVAIIAAKTLAFVSFKGGFGNLVITSQLILVAMALVSGFWRYRNRAVLSLAIVAIMLALEKILKFHTVLSRHVGEAFVQKGLSMSAGITVGSLMYVLVFGALSVVILLAGWRRSDREGRAAIALLGAAFAVMAGTSVVADLIGLILHDLASIDHFTLARGEQGLELITVSALLAISVGVVRVGWRAHLN